MRLNFIYTHYRHSISDSRLRSLSLSDSVLHKRFSFDKFGKDLIKERLGMHPDTFVQVREDSLL